MRPVRVPVLVATAALATGLSAAATGAPGAGRVSPETFARVASGVALVRAFPDCQSKTPGYGTGFLVGPQVIVTALHVFGSPDGRRACRVQVRLSGRWYDTAFAKAWYDGDAAVRHVDLATLKLTRRAPGHVFELARALPARGSTIATIGHPRSLPLSFHQGLLRRSVVSDGVPIVVAHMVAEGGNSGGPIIDREGRVIALVQRVAYPDEDPAQGTAFAAGLNLSAWFAGPAATDLCRAYPQGGIPSCDAAAGGAAKRRWISLTPRSG